MKKAFVLLLLAGMVHISILAQIPGSFKYQAIVRDASGNALMNKSVRLRISILSGSETGTVVFMETHALSTNGAGLADLEIGKGVRNQSYGTFDAINWSTGSYFLKTELDPAGGTSYSLTGTSQLLSVPYALYAGNADAKSKFEVRGDPSQSSDTALFEVKDKTGFTVFAVYEDGAVLNVTNTGKGGKGGFAVGGRTMNKSGQTDEIMFISPDSARFNINNTVRFDLGIPDKKGGKGGFAVGGRTATKGPEEDYFNISPNSSVDVISTQPRILWYPKKEAFMAGRVVVDSPDSVGTNSTATGFESRAIGNWSQAFGFKAHAKKDYSTAIGKNAVAAGMNSFAFGDGAKALQDDAYAFGAFTISRGVGSFALGYVGRDSLGPTGKPTLASGDASFAFGLGTSATNVGSIGLGAEVHSSGVFSFATGFRSIAGDWCATALGDSTVASAGSSTSMGFKTRALEWASTSMGHESEASGPISLATGIWTRAVGGASTSIGHSTKAIGDNSLAGGHWSVAKGGNSMAFGDSSVTDKYNSIACGNRAIALGYESFALGCFVSATHDQAFAIGSHTVASGLFSLATGTDTKASGTGSASFGIGTIASHDGSVAFGNNTVASGNTSTAFGFKTLASEWTSMAIGQETKATGGQSFAAGYQTIASGGASAAFGGNTRAVGSDAMALGASTIAFGFATLATGNTTRALGNESAAFGYQTSAKGFQSVAMGNGTIAKTHTCLAIGQYNDTSGTTINYYNKWDPADPVFVIGDGETESARSNAFTVLKNGNVGIDTALPTQRLDIVRGNGRVQTGYSWLTNSDMRYKKNITTLDHSLQKVMAIRGVRYDVKEDGNSIPGNGKHIGFIAQELEVQFPEFVVTDQNGYKSVAYDKISAVLVEALKEQQQTIDKLKQENEEMKGKLESVTRLESELQQIKAKLELK